VYIEAVSRNSHEFSSILLPYHDEQLAGKVVSKDIHQEFKNSTKRKKTNEIYKKNSNCSKFEQRVVNNVGRPKNDAKKQNIP
jgi:hypothetical protein